MKERYSTSVTLKKIINSPVTPIILLGVVILLAISVVKMYEKNRKTEEARTKVEEKTDELQKQKIHLQKDIEQLSTNRGVEEALRERYHVKKKEEELITVINNEPATTSTSSNNPSWLIQIFK